MMRGESSRLRPGASEPGDDRVEAGPHDARPVRRARGRSTTPFSTTSTLS